MRRILMVAVLSMAFAVPASAAHSIRGVVTAMDDAGKTFTCHWQTSDWTYKTTAKTAFRVGHKAASWSDLKVGETVQVSYHKHGGDRVADQVTITAP
jgi:Domain of unknown function (DUF5666)